MNNLKYGSFRKKSSQSVLYEGEYVALIGMHGGMKINDNTTTARI